MDPEGSALLSVAELRPQGSAPSTESRDRVAAGMRADQRWPHASRTGHSRHSERRCHLSRRQPRRVDPIRTAPRSGAVDRFAGSVAASSSWPRPQVDDPPAPRWRYALHECQRRSQVRVRDRRSVTATAASVAPPTRWPASRAAVPQPVPPARRSQPIGAIARAPGEGRGTRNWLAIAPVRVTLDVRTDDASTSPANTACAPGVVRGRLRAAVCGRSRPRELLTRRCTLRAADGPARGRRSDARRSGSTRAANHRSNR